MVEIASIHVPKAGGTSFLSVLRDWYGSGVSEFYTCNGTVQGIVPWTRVVHGHYRTSMLPARRRITWMREPARRVISHYFYWRMTPPQARVDPHHVAVREGALCLLEFAELPEMRNLHAWHFDGVTPAEFDFVGLVEHTDTEMTRLAAILGQPYRRLPQLNGTASDEYRVFRASPEWRPAIDHIRQLNDLDCALYAEADDLRRRWHRAGEPRAAA